MIILFTGAGGTGKTTLAKAMSDRYELPMVQSTSREVQEKFGILKEDDQLKLTRPKLAELQKAIAERYWASVDGVVEYVSDRTIADHYCYGMMKQWDVVTEDDLDWYEERIARQFHAADLIIYCPTRIFVPESDGLRTRQMAQREVFDTLIRGVVDRFRGTINSLPLTVGPVKTRLQHIHAALLNVGAVEPADRREQALVR